MPEKILIVDDDLDTLRLAVLMLERQGYQILAASSGQQAIAVFRKEKPDLILLDMMMPDMDGLEVTRRLRSDSSGKDVPIIMFTAKNRMADKLQSFDAGIDDYLTKPTQPRELLAHVKAVLSRHKHPGDVEEAADSQEAEYGIGVIAARGGLGVSTLALNLGIALHKDCGKDVVVAEFRPGQGTISLELGFRHSEGLINLLQRKPLEITGPIVEQELITHPSGVRFLLASPRPRHAFYQTSVAQFEAITARLLLPGRVVILDLGVSLNPIAEKVLPRLNQVLVVVEPLPQTLLQTRAMLADLASIGIPEGRVMVALISRSHTGAPVTPIQVQDQLGRPVAVSFTPAPELAYQASNHHQPMILHQPEGLTARQFAGLAERILSRA